MSPDRPSNIRVFVRWHDQTVFAGEEVKCRITFRSVAPSQSSGATGPCPKPPSTQLSRQSTAAHPRQASALHGQSRSKGSNSLAPPPVKRGHRSTLSLTVPPSSSRSRNGPVPWSPQTPQEHRRDGQGAGSGHAHKRSLSIVSIGSATSTVDEQPQATANIGRPQRPARGHTRATSLQILPRGGVMNGPRSASHPQRPYNSHPSPLFNASYPPDRGSFHGLAASDAVAMPDTPGTARLLHSLRSGVDVMSSFKFPMAPSPTSETRDSSGLSPVDGVGSPISPLSQPSSVAMRSRDSVPTINENDIAPAARVLSTTSIGGTPRSSGEFYSLSNNSSETLASEYVTHQPGRGPGRPPHLRQRSSLSPQKAKVPESLMMGYAQVQGSFTLDGSLVNLGPFEEVKRKAVVGGQGGGVIGVETAKRQNGLLRSFGWGSFTSSIGELLGGGELSSIRDMRGIASAKAVPLLSTPQSVLFVDLQLGPGESKTFEYSFKLPKGLPPTHRGKAMKISYSLVIGTQRPGGSKEQQVQSVEIPFRILGSVNSHGEILGHDLMSPYIILRDQARVQSIEKGSHHDSHHQQHHHHHHQQNKSISARTATLNSFLTYVDELVNRPRNGDASGLLSPSAVPSSRRPSVYEAAATAKEAIDLAIIRSNLTAEGQNSANRFEIARNGRRVGVVMLARPSYRLGEAVTMAIDFSGAEIPCYAVHAALETAERVDPSLALRSEASVHRVTRKVYVTSSEATLFARRVVFNPTIPVSATPEFVTSGVSLEWKIRVEFVVPVHDPRGGGGSGAAPNQGAGDDDGDDYEDDEAAGSERGRHLIPRGGGSGPHIPPSAGQPHPLLEEISRDDRGGLVLVAAENLVCESFEVAVPLRVYGAVCNGLERLERDEALEEGLAV